jgi:hypothetical protein
VVLNHFNFIEKDTRKFTGLTGSRQTSEHGAFSVQIRCFIIAARSSVTENKIS